MNNVCTLVRVQGGQMQGAATQAMRRAIVEERQRRRRPPGGRQQRVNVIHGQALTREQ
jgi:hypothetical protein